MTIRARLVGLVLVLLTLVLGGVGLYLGGSLASWSREVLDQELAHRADVISGEVRVEHGELEIEAEGDTTGTQGWPYQVEALDGRVLFGAPGWPRLSAPLGREPFTTVDSGARPVRVHTRTFLPHRGREELVLRVAAPAEAFLDVAQRFRVGLLVALALALVLGALGAGAIAYGATTPLRRLTGDVARIEASSLGTRLDGRGLGPELGVLAATFNALLERLERAFDAQRAFVGRASHALRTPLASILTRAEVTLRRERTAEEYRAALEEIAAAARTSGTLAEGLLALNRADAAKGAAARERVELKGLVDELERLFRVRADEAGVSFAVAAPEGLAVVVDRARLREALDALVDNALRYTPRGGRVTVSAREDAGAALLEVTDSGPGIPMREREQVLEPFFRGKAAEGGPPGSGLGLSVVKAIADAEGAALRLDDAPGGGTRVSLRLSGAPR